MTNQEFKAWFEGFVEAIDAMPTKKQWERVKSRVAEIDGQTVTERIFIERYWRTWGPLSVPYGTGLYYVSPLVHTDISNMQTQNSVSYDVVSAMNALGRADAAELL